MQGVFRIVYGLGLVEICRRDFRSAVTPFDCYFYNGKYLSRHYCHMRILILTAKTGWYSTGRML